MNGKFIQIKSDRIKVGSFKNDKKQGRINNYVIVQGQKAVKKVQNFNNDLQHGKQIDIYPADDLKVV